MFINKHRKLLPLCECHSIAIIERTARKKNVSSHLPHATSMGLIAIESLMAVLFIYYGKRRAQIISFSNEMDLIDLKRLRQIFEVYFEVDCRVFFRVFLLNEISAHKVPLVFILMESGRLQHAVVSIQNSDRK